MSETLFPWGLKKVQQIGRMTLSSASRGGRDQQGCRRQEVKGISRAVGARGQGDQQGCRRKGAKSEAKGRGGQMRERGRFFCKD
eukprot:366525-Chlamydomonas_euryale.AAC.8